MGISTGTTTQTRTGTQSAELASEFAGEVEHYDSGHVFAGPSIPSHSGWYASGGPGLGGMPVMATGHGMGPPLLPEIAPGLGPLPSLPQLQLDPPFLHAPMPVPPYVFPSQDQYWPGQAAIAQLQNQIAQLTIATDRIQYDTRFITLLYVQINLSHDSDYD